MRSKIDTIKCLMPRIELLIKSNAYGCIKKMPAMFLVFTRKGLLAFSFIPDFQQNQGT